MGVEGAPRQGANVYIAFAGFRPVTGREPAPRTASEASAEDTFFRQFLEREVRDLGAGHIGSLEGRVR